VDSAFTIPTGAFIREVISSYLFPKTNIAIHTTNYELPKYKKYIPNNTRAKSMLFLRMFFSLKKSAPPMNATITPLLRLIDTTDIMESGNDKA
jgi:hypothetical protein